MAIRRIWRAFKAVISSSTSLHASRVWYCLRVILSVFAMSCWDNLAALRAWMRVFLVIIVLLIAQI
jgi:hypothetical protein